MAKALSLVAYDALEGQVEALERDGYVYFPSVLNAEESRRVARNYGPIRDNPRVFGYDTKRLKMVAGSSTKSLTTHLIETPLYLAIPRQITNY